MNSRLIACSVILSCLCGNAAANTAPRQPTGNWVVNFAENMCLLQREYGSPQQPLTLGFRPAPTTDQLAVYLVDQATRLRPAYVPVKIGVGPGLPAVEAQLATFDLRDGQLRLNQTGVQRAELEMAAASGGISFDADKRLVAALAVPDLAEALKVLDECVVDLVDSWGFSRERQQAIGRWAVLEKPMHEYVRGEDYPARALNRGESGSNSARYRIDENGRTADCVIVESSGSASLDRILCAVTKRFRYSPAVDRSGKPIDSIGFVRLRWVLA